MDKMESGAGGRREILELDGIRFKSPLPANIHGSFRHIHADSSDPVKLVHGFQSQAKPTPDIEPLCFRRPLDVPRNRANAPFKHPQREAMKSSFLCLLKVDA